MEKEIKGIFLFLSLFSLLSLSGCKKKETAAPSPTGGAESRGELQVLSVTPKGETVSLRQSEAIVVIFDRVMVPLEALPEGQGTSYLRLNPPLAGKFRWLGTKTLVFTPEKKLPAATEIEVEVPAGTRSLEGFTLKDDFRWSFQTIRPFLVRSVPEDKQEWVKLDPQVLLVFNQAVPVDKARKFLSLTGLAENGKESSLGFRASQPPAKRLEEEGIEMPAEHVLLVEPSEKLEPGMTYVLEIREGLPSAQGPLGMKVSRAVSFETFKPFRLEGSDIGNPHNPDEPLRIQFSNRVAYR